MKSAPLLYWTDASVPGVRRAAGALNADPEERGGVAGDSTSGHSLETWSPGLDARRSRFEGLCHLGRLHSPWRLFFGYEDV